MRLIDRYILRQFLGTFFFVVLILVSVITVIDLTEKTEKYVKNNVSAMQILGYYLDFVPWVAGLITPITVFIATVYVTSRMAGRTEIVAILSSGVSFKRLMLPYFLGAFVIASLSFWLNGWIIPNSNKTRLAFEVEYLKGKYYFDQRNIHIQVEPGVFLYMQSYNNTTDVGYRFTMERFEGNRLIEKLSANSIVWDANKEKWILKNWLHRKVDPIFVLASLTRDSIPQDSIFYERPRDVITRGDSKDTTLVIHPKEFESDYRKFDGMTLNDLDEYIETLRARGSAGVLPYEVEKHTRYAAPFSIFILAFMGVIVSARKSRGGTGFQIALGFLLSFIFILFFMMFRSFAEAGSLPAGISVWIPNIIFALIAALMYKYVPR
ncbi:MAG TPA: LptF/LptG family permease [Cyclobacteriaceae bacterium]|nr:LptF/LptG family permease [Cyclobacteriaceae bacterium]